MICLRIWGSLYKLELVHLFNLQYMCLFLHSLIDCGMKVPLHRHCYIVLLTLFVKLTTVCSTRAQPVETTSSRCSCIVPHFLCSKTSFSSRWKDVGVFTISALGYWGKIWGMKYLLPYPLPTSFSYSHPTPILLALLYYYIIIGCNIATSPYIIIIQYNLLFSLSNLMSRLDEIRFNFIIYAKSV